MIEVLHTKWKAIATIAIVVVAALNLSGFCYSETRFLSLEELCERTFKARESQMPMDYPSWRKMWKTQKLIAMNSETPGWEAQITSAG